jgi:DNA-binding NtrC family response regulator
MEHIASVLRQTGGNKKAAAEILGISRRALYRRLENRQHES